MFCVSKEILSQPDFILHLDACVLEIDKSDFTLTLHNLLHIDFYKSNCQDYCQSFACNLRVSNLATTVVWHNFSSFLKYSRCLADDLQSPSAWHAWVIQYYIYHISYMVHIISSFINLFGEEYFKLT